MHVQVVIFVKSVARARELSKLLIDCNFPAICIHSAMGQEERWAPQQCENMHCGLSMPKTMSPDLLVAAVQFMHGWTCALMTLLMPVPLLTSSS